MTPGQVKKISEKLGEILGDAADVGDQKRNEKGEVRLPTLQVSADIDYRNRFLLCSARK